MTINGSNFITSDYDASVSYQGVALTGTVISDTQITIDWSSTGLPISESDTAPSLVFVSTATLIELTATNSADAQISNPSSTPTSSSMSCSYAGGCPYSITGQGWNASLMNSQNSITICGNVCVYDEESSTASEAVCTLPAFATKFSISEYEITEVATMSLTWTGTASDDEVAKLNDGDELEDYTDSSTTCEFRTTFRENYVGILDEVSIFFNELNSDSARALIEDILEFQGSNDDFVSDINTLYTVTTDLHNGWNSNLWEDGSQPSYNSYRYYGTSQGSCRVGEVRFYGVEVWENEDTSYSCTPVMTVDSVEHELEPVTYDTLFTPSLESISPRFGTVYGDTTVTLTGDFGSSITEAYVWFDDRECAIQSISDTQITCLTDDKPYVADEPRVRIYVPTQGNCATFGLVFRYVYYFSDQRTWADFIPLEGESIEIPQGQHLLIDVDATDHLNYILVEGSLIFAPDEFDTSHQRSLDANIILVNGGYFEAGTEDFPYTSKLMITMHGIKGDNSVPIYGQKVIGVRYGQLEMHGVPRDVVWTQMSASSSIGDTQIQIKEEVDWQAGEYIVIASSDYEGRNAEKRQITSVTNNGDSTIITFDEALNNQHFGLIETFGTTDIDMRCEVGLLTRNVVYRGDPETSSTNMFGAHIMLHSPGDESVVGKIEYVELTDVGQAFQLGRYPIHFHMIGTVHQSYVRGNAIHQTYNRAVTLHGVHYFKVQNNVAYDTMGHTIFVEDAAETNNLIEDNLIVQTKRSWSLLNTDSTPACFWITHPKNIIRNNHAAGSDRYGYWFDTQATSTGPSYDPNICPENDVLAEFSGNVAHSVGRYGLRVFHNHIPREKPCQSISATNLAVGVEYTDFTGYKCGRNGAIALNVGAVFFKDFKTADNILAGIEFEQTWSCEDGTCGIDGAVIVGKTSNSDSTLEGSSPHGIITPRSENFRVMNVEFYNFDFNSAAALGSCSHCFHSASTDSGARTVRFEGLSFTDVTYKVRYQTPFRAIYYDMDGSLTGLGAGSWASPYWAHNHWDGLCEEDSTQLQSNSYSDSIGLKCYPSVQVRRIEFASYSPSTLYMQGLYIAKWDDDLVAELEADSILDETIDVGSYYESLIPYKSDSWAVPFVTGHKYRIYWGSYAVDHESMGINVSSQWEEADDSVYFITPYSDVRAEFPVYDSSGSRLPYDGINTDAEELWETGHNTYEEPVIDEDGNTTADLQEFHWIVNGKNMEEKSSITMQGWRCEDNFCPNEDLGDSNAEIEDEVRYWSDPNSWDSGELPVQGDDVEIQGGWNMVYDLEGDSPIFEMIKILGRLTFYQPEDNTTDDDNSEDSLLLTRSHYTEFPSAQVKALDLDVFYYQNRIRTNPEEFYDYMNYRIASFDGLEIPDGCGDGCTVVTNEGAAAVEEALAALEAQAENPGTVMDWEDGMWLAAFDHCADMGPTGETGHTGTDSSTIDDRISRYGTLDSTSGENISYGSNDPLEIVMQLFIDDGVSSRENRTNILSSDLGFSAVSTCCHATSSYQAVITYADGFTADDLTSYIDDAATGVCCTDGGCPEEEVVVEVY